MLNPLRNKPEKFLRISDNAGIDPNDHVPEHKRLIAEFKKYKREKREEAVRQKNSRLNTGDTQSISIAEKAEEKRKKLEKE